MNFFTILGMASIGILGIVFVNSAYAQIDPLSETLFFQTGELQTIENQFQISNDFEIREFFNNKIIRVSGQTLEGFPYITYSKVSDEKIDTHGFIFIKNKFVKLSFIEKSIQINEIEEKKDDLEIVAQYTQRAHSKQYIFTDVKIFEKDQNKYIYFNQNYGFVSNVKIQVIITDENNQEIFSSEGVTNDAGLFETKYLIPDNFKRETLTITINAEDDNSFSSKILQVFTLGNISSNGSTSIIP